MVVECMVALPLKPMALRQRQKRYQLVLALPRQLMWRQRRLKIGPDEEDEAEMEIYKSTHLPTPVQPHIPSKVAEDVPHKSGGSQ